MHDDSNTRRVAGQGTSAMAGFLLGAVVGAGLALLLAPASGQETRHRLAGAARRIRDNTKDQLSHVRDTVSDLKDDARAAVESGRDAFVRGRQSQHRSESRESEPRPA